MNPSAVPTLFATKTMSAFDPLVTSGLGLLYPLSLRSKTLAAVLIPSYTLRKDDSEPSPLYRANWLKLIVIVEAPRAAAMEMR